MESSAPSPEKISDAMREYLAEIYHLGPGGAWVSTTALAERMGVSVSAVVRMASRLRDQQLVEYIPYQGVRLAPAGQKIALLHIRRHRLIECFLVEILKFGWHEAHAQAEQFQKGVNQVIEDRIAELLGQPTTCPHGDPIPTREGVMPELDDNPLLGVPPGTKGIISRVRTHNPAKLEYLAKIGLTPGVPFELLGRAPFNGPLQLQVNGASQMIGAELAAALWVTVQPGGGG
jgi:DtxR family Mn-dependent transcriptional regulator